MKLFKLFNDFYWNLRIAFYSRRIATSILPTLQRDATRKFGPRIPRDDISEQYLDARAAQLSRPLVDELLGENKRIPGLLGNRLIVLSARRAAMAVSGVRYRRPHAA